MLLIIYPLVTLVMTVGTDCNAHFQVCSIQIESFAYDMEDVDFDWANPAIDLAKNIELPQFKLKGAFFVINH